MTRARLCIEEQVDPALAFARAQRIVSGCSAAEPVALYGASLAASADTLVLGAYQQAQQALRQYPGAKPVLRRTTGGITVRAGAGIVYIALGLHDRSALMTCPPLRILNRNVRGALHGLRLLGVQAHYFGRDFLSVDVRPAVFVGWHATPRGPVLVEMFVSDQSVFLPEPTELGYPPRSEDPFRGKLAITLQEAGARAHGANVAQKIADGYAQGFGVEWRTEALSESEGALAQPNAAQYQLQAQADDQLAWSALREESIGFVSAGVRLDGAGKLSALRLAGDFFQDSGCASALERSLLGVEPSPELIGRGLDDVYARGGHELEGVRSLLSFQEAILDAAQRARSLRA